MIYLVSLFWLCVFGYIPYHFRDTATVRGFCDGFCLPWTVVITTEEPPASEFQTETGFGIGALLGCVSILVAAGLILGFAFLTIRWCL